MANSRDYNAEIKDTDAHRYAYDFDLEVMHGYMVRSFQPFFRGGSLLELGSFRGDLTKRLLPYFDDVTCVDASDVAIATTLRVADAEAAHHSLSSVDHDELAVVAAEQLE